MKRFRESVVDLESLKNFVERTIAMKKIALTGATSMIGIGLIQECIENDVEVTAIIRKGSPNRHFLPKSDKISILELNLGDLSTYEPDKSMYCDVFYHFAWEKADRDGRNDCEFQMKNIEYTLAAVGLAKKLGCSKFIGAGSQAEYGATEEKLFPETPVNPDTAYGVAKYASGKLSSISCEQIGMEHIWARVASVYGPYDNEATMIMYSLDSLLRGKKPSYSKSEQQWDYLYYADAAKAFFLLGQFGKNKKVYCVAGGESRPLREYIYILRDSVNPDAQIGIGEKPSEHLVKNLIVDIEDLKSDTGFYPKYDFRQGIQETIEWFKRRKEVKG